MLGNQTLRFRGPTTRLVETKEFDIRYGGELEYDWLGGAMLNGCNSHLFV